MKKRIAVVVAGILTLFSGCFQCVPSQQSTHSGGDGGGSKNATCQDSRQECRDWRCASGRVTETTPDTNWRFQGTEATLPLTGEFRSPTNNYRVTTFRVVELDDGSLSATYETRSCAALTISLIDDQHATMTYNGVTFDGHGNLSADQQQALDSLRQSPFIDALVQVPLDLGCRPSMPARPLAALLFPWQLFLKYESGPSSRVQSLEALAAETQCDYFGDRDDHETVDGHDRMGPLQFARSDVIPNVFGTFPLDAVGATEDPTNPLEGDLSGPCGAKCRGACGPDCPTTCSVSSSTECSVDGGVDMRVITHSCGVHDGCVEHDDCYDACHSSYGCGSWRAALCRRGCDAQAVSHWGAGNGASWARGGGPYQRTVDFVNRVPSPGECSCVAPGTQVATADGGQLPIEKLREGDVIWGFDVDAGVLVKSTVERLLVHRADYTLDLLVAEGGGELALTENHPVFTQRGYVRAEDLALGDSLVIVDEVAQQTRQERLIAILRRQSASTVTYNLKTTVGNYFAADMLIHNKCLSSDSMIDTPSGSVVITSVRPGDLVWGRRAGRQVESRVESVFKKTTILPSLSGRRVNDALSLTDNHVLAETGRPAGDLKAPHVDIEGAVYDLATDTGNYVAGGVLVEGARP